MNGRISKWGNSLAVRIPGAVAEVAGLYEGNRVRIEAARGKVTLAAETMPQYQLRELLRGYSRRQRHPETDWGRRRGGEEW